MPSIGLEDNKKIQGDKPQLDVDSRLEGLSEQEILRIADIFMQRGICKIDTTVGKLNMENEKERFAIAKRLLFSTHASYLLDTIEKYDLSLENRLYIAKICVEKDIEPWNLCGNMENFDIEDEKERLNLIKSLIDKSKSNMLDVIDNIDKFNITDEKERLNLARVLGEMYPYEVLENIENFEIKSVSLIKDLMIKSECENLGDIGNIQWDIPIFLNTRQMECSDRKEIYINVLKKICSDIDVKDVKISNDIAKCRKIIDNLTQLKDFYGEETISINFDMSALLKQDDVDNTMKAINDIRDIEQRQKVIIAVENMLYKMSQMNVEKEIMCKDEIAKLILEFATIRNPELREYLMGGIVNFVNDDKLSKISEEIKHNNKKKAYPAINAIVFDELGLYEDKEILFGIREAFSKNSFLKNSKDVYDTLIALINLKDLHLEQRVTKDILKFLIKNQNDISKNSRYITAIISFKGYNSFIEINGNSKSDAIKDIFYSVYKYMGIQDNAEFMKRYQEFINLKDNVNRNFEENLIIYISKNKDKEDIVKACRQFMFNMVDKQEFRNARYNIKSSKHLETLNSINRDVYEKWTRGEYKVSVNEALITDDPVDLFLIGTEIDGSCQSVKGGSMNIALLGYVIDGKNKAVVIKNDSGRIIARSIIRLLIEQETNEIVMTKEIMYSANGIDHKEVDKKLEEACIEYAKWLGVSLVARGVETYDKVWTSKDSIVYHKPSISQASEDAKYTKTLISQDSQAPYEYVDMGHGLTKGKYEINNEVDESLVYLYNLVGKG